MGQNDFFFFFFCLKRAFANFVCKHLVMKLVHLQLPGIQSSLSVSEIEEESSSANEIINFNNHGLVRTKMIK